VFLLEQLAQLAQRAGDDLLHVGEAQPQDLGDLRTVQVAAEAQREDLAVAV
jgi:hypothetical protein